MQNPIDALIELFSRFPGVGPRQARRFAYYLLTRDNAKVKSFVEAIVDAKKTVVNCASCMRLFSADKKGSKLCQLCSDSSRDESLLLVVAHDVDVESIEKSGSYRGHYFVLGGTVPILEEKPQERIRIQKLLSLLKERSKKLTEVILGLDLNPEGDHTAEYVSRELKTAGVKVSLLGKGLSTGTELQYSDPETIKNALQNRS